MFHGKVSTFKSREKFKDALNQCGLSRNKFVDIDLKNRIDDDINKSKPLNFYVVDTSEIHVGNYGNLEYKIVLFCVTEDGVKNSLILDNILPYFDLLLENTNLEKILEILSEADLRPKKTEEFEAKYGKYLNTKNQKWVRIFYNTTINRKKALSILEGYTTSNNDTAFKNIVFRTNKILAAGWNRVTQYTYDRSTTHSFLKTENVRIFNLDYRNIKEFGKIDTIPTMLYEKTLIANFDIETTSDVPIGDKPPDYNKLDTDKIFMISVNFSFRTDKEPFLVVNINSLAHFRDPKALNIYCSNQYEIVEAFGQILGKMNPDKITDFNGGNYDWPFVIAILEDNEVRHYNFIKDLSMVDPDAYCSNFLLRPKLKRETSEFTGKSKKSGVTEEMIKIEADRNHDIRTYKLPGYIPIDIRPMMMQIYPKEQKSSLNFYLEMANLKPKEDMAYTYMFAIEKVVRILSRRWGMIKLDDLIGKAQSIIEEDRKKKIENPEFVPELLLSPKDVGAFTKSPYKLHLTTTEKILQMFKDVVLVASYCNYDAISCHLLTKKRNLISDKHDVCHLSYNDPYDAFYRANGMKIRNLMISKGQAKNYVFSNTNVYGLETAVFCQYPDPKDEKKTITVMKKDLKFPGAYVNPPKKGLYRDSLEIKLARLEKIRLALTGRNPKDLEIIEKFNNDFSQEIDRPCAGLDFSSLYPNVMNTINASPEMVLDPRLGLVPKLHFKDKIAGIYDHEVYMLELDGKPVYFRRITYYYKGHENVKECLVDGYIAQKTVIIGKRADGTYIVHNDPDLDGLYPMVLKELHLLRGEAKKMMEKYGSAIELLKSIDANANITKEYVREFLADFRRLREKEYAEKPVDFNKYQLEKLSHIEAFIEQEYFGKDISYLQFWEDIQFFQSYYNSKQNAIKVYMNSIYGELGNKRSANFVPVLSGGVTTHGVKFIKAVKKFVLNKGFRVLYGDTDSLYICAPEQAFLEIDELYRSGKISKLEYWTQMIDITMKKLDILKKEVFEFLKLITGNIFLSMAYEEVLYPYALLGQKKYIGIQHQNIIDLSICNETNVEKFKKSKSLFIRGLEMTKRGGSPIMRDCSYYVFMTAFNINEERSLREIVEDQLRVINEKYDNGGYIVNDFVRTQRYKLPPMKNGEIELDKNGNEKGNKTVLKFVDRMTIVNRHIPTIKPPDVGERFRYIMVRRSEKIIDLNGRKKDRPVGDFVEYPESFDHPEYAEYLGQKLEININYYVKEIMGQLARFLAYHTDFSGIVDDNIYEDKELYTKFDKKATKSAYKYLEIIWDKKFKKPENDTCTLHKIITGKERERFDSVLENIFGEDSVVFNRTKLGETLVSLDIGGYGDFIRVKNSDKAIPKLVESLEKDMEKTVSEIMDGYNFYETYYGSMTKKKAEQTRKLIHDYCFNERTYSEMSDFNTFIEAVKANPKPFRSEDSSGRKIKQGIKIELRNKLYGQYMKTKAELISVLGDFIKDMAAPIKTLQDIHELDCFYAESSFNEYNLNYVTDINEDVWNSTIKKYGLDSADNYAGKRETIQKVSELIIRLTTDRLLISEILSDTQYHREKRINSGRIGLSTAKKMTSQSSVNTFLNNNLPKKSAQDTVNERILKLSSNI